MHPMFWLMLGVAALLGEAMSRRLFLLIAALAAFIVAPLSLVAGPVPQIIIFGALTVLLVGLLRPRLLHALTGRVPRRTLTTVGRLMDRTAVVTRTVTADDGMIRIGTGEFWTARTFGPLRPIPAGMTVRIAYVDGLAAYVAPVARGGEDLRPLEHRHGAGTAIGRDSDGPNDGSDGIAMDQMTDRTGP